MDAKIKVGKVQSYTTTDGKMFSGKGATKKAEKHQWALDKKDLFEKFDVFMRKTFGLKCKYDPENISEEEEMFCNNIMREVDIRAESGDFTDTISELIFDLYGFIGQERWLQIHDFLTKKR
jgi:hypothetical protein